MNNSSVKVLGICGSLRESSFNRALLDAAPKLAPSGMVIETHSIDEVPLYNADVEARGDPAPVERLKSAIRAADGLLIATPEYNYGIPGVLKNAIDWASRPPAHSVLNGKPAALMGTSPGMSGRVVAARGPRRPRRAEVHRPKLDRRADAPSLGGDAGRLRGVVRRLAPS